MKVSKQGSTLAGIMDAFSISVSLGLQHGVPLSTYVRKYANMRLSRPASPTTRICGSPPASSTTSSAGWPWTTCRSRSVPSSASSPRRSGCSRRCRASRTGPRRPPASWRPGRPESSSAVVDSVAPTRRGGTGHPPTARWPGPSSVTRPYCYQCGNAMQRAGSCYVCSAAGRPAARQPERRASSAVSPSLTGSGWRSTTAIRQLGTCATASSGRGWRETVR